MGRFPSRLKMIIVRSTISFGAVQKLILSWVVGKVGPKHPGGGKKAQVCMRKWCGVVTVGLPQGRKDVRGHFVSREVGVLYVAEKKAV